MLGICLGLAFVGGVAFGWFGIALATLFAALLTLKRQFGVGVMIAIAVLSALGAIRAVPPPSLESPGWVDDVGAMRGSVVSGPLSTERGQRFNLRLSAVRIDGDWREVRAETCVYAPASPEVRRGDRLYLSGTLRAMSDLPSGVARAFAARGCRGAATAHFFEIIERGQGVLYAADGRRQGMVRQLLRIAPGDTGALMAGLVTGDDGALSDEARQHFVVTGTTHITAVSGSNIALVVVVIVAFGGHLGVHRRAMWQVATACTIWGYAVLVGMEPPALRAAMVATGALFAVLVGRRPDIVTLTVLAAALQLMARPEDYWTLSFRLSFVSALALALVLRGRELEGGRAWLLGALVATSAAQIATTPILLASFGRLSLIALPTNVLIAPLVGLAFPLALVTSLLGAVWEPFGEAFGALAALLSALILMIVEWMARFPGGQMVSVQPNAFEIGLVSLVCCGLIVWLSADGRRVTREGWVWIRAEPRSALALGLISGVGCLIGLTVGAIR